MSDHSEDDGALSREEAERFDKTEANLKVALDAAAPYTPKKARELPQIVLPKLNRQESRFASDVGRAIGPLNVLFRHQDAIVEIKNELFTGEFDKSKLA